MHSLSSDEKIRCPNCGGPDTRHSKRRGILDTLMTTFGKSPFRCRACNRRFYISDTASDDVDEHADEAADA